MNSPGFVLLHPFLLKKHYPKYSFPYIGKNFEHRRQWIEDRLLELAEAFAIDIAAYAVLSNHYHGVLHINREMAQQWSITEVIEH